jgi:hypothetical protein
MITIPQELIAARQVSEAIYKTNCGDLNGLSKALRLAKVVLYLIPASSLVLGAYLVIIHEKVSNEYHRLDCF